MTRRAPLALVLIALLAACTLTTSDNGEPSTLAPPVPVTRPAADTPLVVTWVAGGDLFSWHSGTRSARRIASGGAIRAFVSPDGESVAYLRGPGGDTRSLWIGDTRGATERELIDASTLPETDGTRRLKQVVWAADARAIYFNTLTGSGIDTRPADDLWRVVSGSGTAERLLPDGEGGQVVLSPDGRRLALVGAGSYGSTPGRIAFYNPNTRRIEGEPFTFPAVATASESRWYAAPRWLPDGSGLRVAIPPPDLVYGSGPDTALWTLPVEGTPQQIGSVAADFFGLPRFAPGGDWIAYIQRRETLDQDAITLMLARADGSEPVTVMDGAAGALAFEGWFPAGDRFLVQRGTPGEVWLAGAGIDPARFPAADMDVQAVVWADTATYVFSSQTNSTFTLNFGLLDVPTGPQIIATPDAYPFFDAVLP